MKSFNIYHSPFIKKPLLAVLICLSFLTVGFAQTSQTDFSAQAALVTEFDVNGLKVLVKRRPNSPTVVAGLFIRGGVKNLDAKIDGIENFMLEAASEGSQKYPRETLRRELAATASSIDAGATYDYSVLSLGATKQNFDRSWNAFTDVALHPTFAPADVERVRQQLLTELRNSTDDPESNLQELQNKVIYANHPYLNDPEGTIDSVSRFTAADLRNYHEKVMQTSHLLLVIVGDLDASDLQRRIADTFGKLPRGDYKEQPTTTLSFVEPTLDVTARTLPTNYVSGVFQSPSFNDPDYSAMRVATSILGGRVFQEVRVKRNLSYAPDANLGLFASNTGNISVSAVDANQAVSVMLNEINQLKTEPVDEREISGVTGLFLTNYYLGQETDAAQAVELARYELIGGGWRNSFEFLNRVRQVTPADVQRVAQKYMTNLRFVVLGNPASVDRQIFLQKKS
ncbi:MAG: M16 family metallopeptidase [Pyrinomonadaceae bacterium]